MRVLLYVLISFCGYYSSAQVSINLNDSFSDLPFKSFVKTVEFIPLGEGGGKALLDYPEKIVVDQDRIFVLDKMDYGNSIYSYDLNGVFDRKTEFPKGGPSALRRIIDFDIHDTGLIVLDGVKRVAALLDENMQVNKVSKQLQNPASISSFCSGIVLAGSVTENLDEAKYVTFMNDSLEFLRTAIPINKALNNTYFKLTSRCLARDLTTNEVYFNPVFSNIIYSLQDSAKSKSDIIVLEHSDFDANKELVGLPPEEVIEMITDISKIHDYRNVYADNQVLFFTYDLNEQRVFVFFDILKKKYKQIPIGRYVKKNILFTPFSFVNQSLYFVYRKDVLLDNLNHFPDEEFKNDVMKFNDKNENHENPVLVKVTLDMRKLNL